MLFLGAPYGERKLFALVPAYESCAQEISESHAGKFGLHAAAGAHHPQKAQATRNAARKSNDNRLSQPDPERLDYHTQPRTQNRQKDTGTRHTPNGSLWQAIHSATPTQHSPANTPPTCLPVSTTLPRKSASSRASKRSLATHPISQRRKLTSRLRDCVVRPTSMPPSASLA
jgi:hypothetical protein